MHFIIFSLTPITLQTIQMAIIIKKSHKTNNRICDIIDLSEKVFFIFICIIPFFRKLPVFY